MESFIYSLFLSDSAWHSFTGWGCMLRVRNSDYRRCERRFRCVSQLFYLVRVCNWQQRVCFEFIAHLRVPYQFKFTLRLVQTFISFMLQVTQMMLAQCFVSLTLGLFCLFRELPRWKGNSKRFRPRLALWGRGSERRPGLLVQQSMSTPKSPWTFQAPPICASPVASSIPRRLSFLCPNLGSEILEIRIPPGFKWFKQTTCLLSSVILNTVRSPSFCRIFPRLHFSKVEPKYPRTGF